MRLNSKGQVTIPSDVRHRLNLREGDEVDIVEIDGEVRIVRNQESSRGQRTVDRMRGRGTVAMTTDEILALLRDE